MLLVHSSPSVEVIVTGAPWVVSVVSMGMVVVCMVVSTLAVVEVVLIFVVVVVSVLDAVISF